MGRHSRIEECFSDVVGQILLRELLPRNIDADDKAAVVKFLILPSLELSTSFAKHPPPQRNDEAGFFSNRYELGGPNESPNRMTPTRKRFELGDCPGDQGNDGLVMQFKLTAVETFPEIGTLN
jgi:hypothetical protein